MVDGILSGSLSSQEVHTVTGQVSPVQSVTGNISIGGYDDLPLYDGSYEITPTEQEQTVNTAGRVVEYDIVVDPIPDEYVDISESTLDNADELSEGVIAFGADGTQYVGTVPDKSASDITVSGDTVTVPPGRYTESISKAVAAGSRGTPSRSFMKTGEYHRTDFSFPNFTPGYMSSMPDLSSSLLTETRIVEPDDSVQHITPTGNSYYLDCVIVQAIPSGTAGTPVATKGTVSNHSVSVTPSVTNTTGYIEGGSKTGTPVTVSASELVSGTKTISENGTGIDVTNYANVDVAIPGRSYIITLSYVYDDDEDAYVWRPDRTWAEIHAARLAGKDLLWQCDDSVANASVWDWDYASVSGEYVYYVVRLVGANSIWNEYCFNAQEHVYLTDSWNDYYVDDATISSGSQLPSGVSAYGEGGVKYVGNAANRTSSDLTVSGPTVTAPAGYYAQSASNTVASGAEGNPTASKGAVSNHVVSVTPSVTNTTGYIDGGTHVGTPVTVSASELVSGTKTISENGTGIDVANYASVDVAVPSGGSDTLVVTLSWVDDYFDEGEGAWVPDVSFADISSAYTAEKQIVVVADDEGTGMATADGFFDGEFAFWFWVFDGAHSQSAGDPSPYISYGYVNEDGADIVWIDWVDNLYSTQNATISGPAQLPSGVTAFGADGLVTGTAQSRTSSDLTISGATVTAPAGYYGSTATASIGNATIDELHLTNLRFETGNNERWWAFDVTADVYGGYIASGQYAQAGSFHAIPANTTIIPTTSSQTVGGANYMMEGAVTVAAMPTGTAGTPTATKGTVSNHSVTVTPSVTNTTGYISGGTKTGTAVSVSASELVSGTYTVDSSGTKDVTNYASASIPAGTAGTPSATKGSVSNHSVTVTPSVTNSTGWITGSTKTGTGVSVSASELVSGTKTISANGTGIDVANYAAVDVSVPSGGGDSTFVVTLSWDSNFGNNGGWVPNKTYAEISAAYTAEKDIVVDCDGGAYVEPLYITAEGVWVSEESSFWYCTRMLEDIQLEPGKWAEGVIETWYVYQSSGLTEDSSSVYYNTADATISTSAQLPSGITAYGNGMRYVGTAANRSSADAVPDGPEIIFPAGYYASTHAGIVQGGSAGTPTATKGTVSNHSISVTPSVTNTEGWISGGTKTGSAVTVSASELVSGSQTVASNQTVDVTNLASVTVAVPIVTYYTGSSDPSSSLGQNGDIYLKVVS